MIKDLCIMWIGFYPFLSLIIFAMFLAMAKIKPTDRDINDLLREFRNMIDEVYEVSPKFANMLEFIIEEGLTGNMFPILLFLLISCFIPVIRLVILKSILTK